jgi:hypothetical protein
VGALLFIASCTRPDVTFAVHILSRFLSKPNTAHWNAAVDVLLYLKGTSEKGIVLGGGGAVEIQGFADSDWAANTDDRTSISGGVIFWGESPVMWLSRKQRMVCTSTAEAETHAVLEVAKEIICVSRFVGELLTFVTGLQNLETPTIFTDNQPALDSLIHGRGRTKHYDIRIKFLAKSIQEGVFKLLKVSTVDNLADVFTKPLRATRFHSLMEKMVHLHGNSDGKSANQKSEFQGRCGECTQNILREKKG